MEDYREKRRYARVDTHIPVKYHMLGTSSDPQIATTVSRNLSEGGVHFRTDEFVARACRLVMELNMPMFNKPLKAIGKVAWIRKASEGDGYEVGNRFLDITRNDKRLLSDYLDSLKQYND